MMWLCGTHCLPFLTRAYAPESPPLPVCLSKAEQETGFAAGSVFNPTWPLSSTTIRWIMFSSISVRFALVESWKAFLAHPWCKMSGSESVTSYRKWWSMFSGAGQLDKQHSTQSIWPTCTENTSILRIPHTHPCEPDQLPARWQQFQF